MNNLFQRLCSVRSFLLSRKHHYLFATGSFHFRTGQAKLSQDHFYLIHFLKVRHFPEKIDNKPLPGVFLEASLCYNRLAKQSFIRFLYGAGVASQVARKSSRPKSYRPEPESCCPKYIVMSPEILSHVARNFIKCINLKKSNILSKLQGINS